MQTKLKPADENWRYIAEIGKYTQAARDAIAVIERIILICADDEQQRHEMWRACKKLILRDVAQSQLEAAPRSTLAAPSTAAIERYAARRGHLAGFQKGISSSKAS